MRVAPALPDYRRQPSPLRVAQQSWLARADLAEIKHHELLATQAGREQYVDDRAITPRARVTMLSLAVVVAPALRRVKALQTINDALQRPDLCRVRARGSSGASAKVLTPLVGFPPCSARRS